MKSFDRTAYNKRDYLNQSRGYSPFIKKQQSPTSSKKEKFIVQEVQQEQLQNEKEYSPQIKKQFNKSEVESNDEYPQVSALSNQPSKHKLQFKEKLNNIRQRLKSRDIDRQSDIRVSQDLNIQGYSPNSKEERNQNKSGEHEDENETMKTFAMDVNESFGTYGTKKLNSILKKSQENKNLDYDSRDNYSTKRREDTDKNDPLEILKSLREGVKKSINESKVKNNSQEFAALLMTNPEERRKKSTKTLNFNNPSHVSQSDDSATEQSAQFNSFNDHYIADQRRKLQVIQDEYERQQNFMENLSQNDDDQY